MLIPVIPLPESLKKNAVLISKQLIQDLDYSISLIAHSHQKLSCLKSGVRVASHDPCCLKSGVRVASHDPFSRSNYFSGIVSIHKI